MINSNQDHPRACSADRGLVPTGSVWPDVLPSRAVGAAEHDPAGWRLMSKRRAMVELDIGAHSIEIRLSGTAAVFTKRPARLDVSRRSRPPPGFGRPAPEPVFP